MIQQLTPTTASKWVPRSLNVLPSYLLTGPEQAPLQRSTVRGASSCSLAGLGNKYSWSPPPRRESGFAGFPRLDSARSALRSWDRCRRALCDKIVHRTEVAKMGAPPSPANEGMQLYSTPAHEGLQLADGNSYAYGPGAPIEPDSAVPPSAITEHKYDEPPLPAYAGRTICGLAARVFWTIVGVAILLLVIAAAVGGGVGGSQAARHAKEAANARLVTPDIIHLTYFNYYLV